MTLVLGPLGSWSFFSCSASRRKSGAIPPASTLGSVFSGSAQLGKRGGFPHREELQSPLGQA